MRTATWSSLGAERRLRDAKIAEIYDGTNQIQSMLVARDIRLTAAAGRSARLTNTRRPGAQRAAADRINGPLSGIRVVEAASFVAAPSAGMALSQLGADVIRVDPPGGGSDAGRWPLSTAARACSGPT